MSAKASFEIARYLAKDVHVRTHLNTRRVRTDILFESRDRGVRTEKACENRDGKRSATYNPYTDLPGDILRVVEVYFSENVSK